MAPQRDQKPVTQLEVVLLFCLAAGLGCVVLLVLVTGWVWIPGQRFGGQGYWTNRADSPGSYFVYLAIVGAATLGFLAVAMARHRRFMEQTWRRRRTDITGPDGPSHGP